MDRPNFLTHTGKMNMLSKIPLVELAGHSRVLIENHLGILTYSLEEIKIKVTYGMLTVEGCNLKIMQLSRDQMVITGQIQALQLYRR